MTLILYLLILAAGFGFLALLVSLSDAYYRHTYERRVSDEKQAQLALRSQRTVSRMPRS